MASHTYRRLLEQISQLTLIPETSMSEELTHLSIREVSFSLYALEDRKHEYLVIHADMGPLPQQRRDEVLMRLLDINFFLFDAPRTSSFSRNVQDGNVMFSVAQPLTDLTGQLVLDQLGFMADQALIWRDNYFLDSQSPAGKAPAQQGRPVSSNIKTNLTRSIL